MEQRCLGCKDECDMDSPTFMTGCVYEDGVYPKNARIWYMQKTIDTPEMKEEIKNLIKKTYPDEWEQEEH
jgi:hypothetical protein